MVNKTSIYVVTHKTVDLAPLQLEKCYRLIRVGAYGGEKSALLSDREGESISEKNPNYCELTALYWMWKNDHTSDVVGLCHYRRFFTSAALSTSPQHILKEEQIQTILRKYDVIAARKEYSYRGAYQAYLDCGREKDLAATEAAIAELCPEYLPAFESEFKKSAGNYPANMMICSKERMDSYCSWLFSILEHVETHTSLEGYSAQEARIYGYLSERLLGVWLKTRNLRVKQLRVLNTEQKPAVGRELCKAIGLEQAVKQQVFRIRNRKK